MGLPQARSGDRSGANELIAAKDVDGGRVLQAVERLQSGIGASRRDIGFLFPGVPERVLLAKLRRLTLAGKVDGCFCGCRGDFTVS